MYVLYKLPNGRTFENVCTIAVEKLLRPANRDVVAHDHRVLESCWRLKQQCHQRPTHRTCIQFRLGPVGRTLATGMCRAARVPRVLVYGTGNTAKGVHASGACIRAVLAKAGTIYRSTPPKPSTLPVSRRSTSWSFAWGRNSGKLVP